MSVSGSLAGRGLEALCGLSLLLQTLEFLALCAPLDPGGVWAFAVQGDDLAHAPPWARRLFAVLARPYVHRLHLALRLAAAASLMLWGASLGLILFLFAGTLALLIRWRGAFNGGSDFMTVVALTGLLIATSLSALDMAELGWRAGLIYVAIQSATSYFISGAVKLRNRDWRQGRALAPFLDAGVYGPLSRASVYWRPPVAILCSWGFILWECSVPLALLDPRAALGFCATGVVFHFLVFWYLGLNRFFFAWIATYPAILYVATQLA